MKKYRKKPVVIEAMQFTEETKNQVFNFVTCNKFAHHDYNGNPILDIWTLEGRMTAQLGDWIIKGVQGEFYPCKPDIFEATYEPVQDIHITVHPPEQGTRFSSSPGAQAVVRAMLDRAKR